MVVPAAHTEWTVDLLDSLPESSDRFELIDGELFVTPAPGEPHQTECHALAWPGRRREVLTDRLEWRPLGTTEAFVLDLTAFFDKALD
jgi:hypothetical protein